MVVVRLSQLRWNIFNYPNVGNRLEDISILPLYISDYHSRLINAREDINYSIVGRRVSRISVPERILW